MNTPGPMSYLINSSIHDGLGRAITIRYSLNVTIQNNVLYNCDQLLTMLYSSNYIYYLSNLLIGIFFDNFHNFTINLINSS